MSQHFSSKNERGGAPCYFLSPSASFFSSSSFRSLLESTLTRSCLAMPKKDEKCLYEVII